MERNCFDTLAEEYEAWFIKNKVLFQSELLALKQVVPAGKKGVEIGIGSGIFAEQLGIRYGIDPSEPMLEYARQRSLDVQNGIAEQLPYENESYDFTVLINTICFVDDPDRALVEASRILRSQGEIIVAILDKQTLFGKFLEKEKRRSRFYKHARFFSVSEIRDLLERHRFRVTHVFQTLENPATSKIENPEEGSGKGSFVVLKGKKV